VVTSANVSVGFESHASVAVGVANEGVAGHSIVVGPGSAEINGAVVSLTVTGFVQVLEQPFAVVVRVRVKL
jgi:hypothetical protein